MAKKKTIKTLNYNDFRKTQDEIFQITLRSYCCTRDRALGSLVSVRRVKSHILDLVSIMDDFAVDDKINGIKVKAYVESFSYNNASGEAIAKVAVEVVTDNKKLKKADEQARSMFTRIYLDNDKKSCAITLFDSLVGALNEVARDEYFKAIRNMYGSDVETSYYD